MMEISAHELSEQRQRQMVEDEVRRRDWGGVGGHELVFDPEKVHEKMKESRTTHTEEVRIQML